MLIGFKTLGRPICVNEDDRVVPVSLYLFSRAFYEIEMYITFSASDGTGMVCKQLALFLHNYE